MLIANAVLLALVIKIPTPAGHVLEDGDAVWLSSGIFCMENTTSLLLDLASQGPSTISCLAAALDFSFCQESSITFPSLHPPPTPLHLLL